MKMLIVLRHAPKLIGMIKFFWFFISSISYVYNPRRYEHRRRPASNEQMRNNPMGYKIERKIGRKITKDPNF
jgi:cbb3-type cytochrome oxidase subunit 3